MNDSTPNPPVGLPKLDPVAVHFALGSDVRWPIVKLLADGRALNTSEVAAAFGRDLDGIGKQLHVLAAAGVVALQRGKDQRQAVYSIPAARRPAPGVLDYGFCVIDLNKA
jgi:hypothetical protein